MEIVEIARDRLKVILDAEERKEFAIDLDGMNYSGKEHERMLEGILAVVRAKTDFGSEKGRIYVQFYPSRDGGCELFLIHIPNEKREDGRALVPFREERGYLCFFEDAEQMGAFCRLMQARGMGGSDCFFRNEGEKYLLYVAPDCADPFFLEEFGQETDLYAKRYLEEHFQRFSKE